MRQFMAHEEWCVNSTPPWLDDHFRAQAAVHRDALYEIIVSTAATARAQRQNAGKEAERRQVERLITEA